MDSTTVAFPVVGKPIPTFPPTAGGKEWTPEEFREQVLRDPPHWIVHLLIEPTSGEFRSRRFNIISSQDLENLHRCLGLRGGGVSLLPREFMHGDLQQLPDRSPYSFELAASFPGRSAHLAVVVGIVAGATRRPLPPWVLFTGAVTTPFAESLHLDSTGDILPKLLLAFGRDPGYAILPVLQRLYPHPQTEERLGDFKQRVCPDRIKLFITSTAVDAQPHEFEHPLSAESIDCDLEDFTAAGFEELEEKVRSLVGDDLMLVQVPTAFHALRLLGFQHAHPLIEERLRETAEPPRFFRVRHAAVSEGPLIRRPEFEAQMERARLETMLAGARDCRRKLQIILARCIQLLRCQSGDIGVLRGEHWLEVFCREHRTGPDSCFVPASMGITGRVLRNNQREVVTDTATDPDFVLAQASTVHSRQPYPPETIQAYQRFLKDIRACVKFPLCRDGVPVGVLCLHREISGAFNENVVGLLAVLVERAAEEVSRHLAEEQRITHLQPTFVGRLRRQLIVGARWLWSKVPRSRRPNPKVHRRTAAEALTLFQAFLGWLNPAERRLDGTALAALGDNLHRLCPPGPAWLWLFPADQAFAPCVKAWDSLARPQLTIGGLLNDLGTEPIRMDLLPSDTTLHSLAEAFDEPLRSEILARPRIAIPLSAGGRPLALFFQVVETPEALDAETASLLRQVAEMFRTGGQLVARPSAGLTTPAEG